MSRRRDAEIDYGPEPTLIGQRLLHEATGESELSKAVTLLLHDKRIQQIQCLEACPNLRTIDFSFNQIAKIEGISHLTKLKELKLYDNKISQIGTTLQPLSALHTLDLSSNKINDLQGLRGLRGLRVLRLAHNQLPSLEGMGHATGLEVLDASNNSIKDLAGLSSCVSLKQLLVNGNQLVNLKGVQRCQALEELHAADNRLTTLQGLKIAVKTLDVLNISSNRLTSIDSLADGCIALSELYLADNAFTTLRGLEAKAPNLETLDAACNQLADLEDVQASLMGLPSLASVRLEGNRQLPNSYPKQLLESLSQLDSIDQLDRVAPAEVLVLEQDGDDKGEDSSRFDPTVAEMEKFKQRMGISSNLPVMGRPGTPSSGRPPSAHAMMRSSLGGAGAMLRPGTSSSSRPGTSSNGRPGSSSCRPGSGGRPGSGSSGSGALAVRDIMMHQRPPSARTGASAQLMAPEQYTKEVAGFRDTMEQYSCQLRSALSAIKSGLKLDVAAASAQLKEPGKGAARDLPSIPRMPALPKDFARGAPPPGAAPAAAGAAGAAGTVPASPAPVAGLARDPFLDDPEVAGALHMYKRLFPDQPQQAGDHGSGTPQLPVSGRGRPLGPGAGKAVLGSASRGAEVEADGEDSDREEVIRGGGGEEEEEGAGVRQGLQATGMPHHGGVVGAGVVFSGGQQLRPRLGAGGASGSNSPSSAGAKASVGDAVRPGSPRVALGKAGVGAAAGAGRSQQQRPTSATRSVGPKARMHRQG